VFQSVLKHGLFAYRLWAVRFRTTPIGKECVLTASEAAVTTVATTAASSPVYDFDQLEFELTEKGVEFLVDQESVVVYVVGTEGLVQRYYQRRSEEGPSSGIRYDTLLLSWYIVPEQVTGTEEVTGTPDTLKTIIEEVLAEVEKAPRGREVLILGMDEGVNSSEVLSVFADLQVTSFVYRAMDDQSLAHQNPTNEEA